MVSLGSPLFNSLVFSRRLESGDGKGGVDNVGAVLNVLVLARSFTKLDTLKC